MPARKKRKPAASTRRSPPPHSAKESATQATAPGSGHGSAPPGADGAGADGSAPSPVCRWPPRDVARHLLDHARERPAIVVALPEAAGQPCFDAADLARRTAGNADVFEIPTGPRTYELADALPPGTSVYGNAARVYPAGSAWREDHRPRPPRIPWTAADLAQLSDQLVQDVAAALVPSDMPAGHPGAGERTATRPARATARVKGFAAQGRRALVVLEDNGHEASIHAEDLAADIPLDWMVSIGQALQGVYEADTGTFDIRNLLARPSFADLYPDGGLALARVTAVTLTDVRLMFWPGLEFPLGIGQISSNDLDSAQDLLTEGEVVCVRVHYELGRPVLSMLDVDDDEPVLPAPVLIPGGPPWLSLDRPYAGSFAPPAPAAPAAAHDLEPRLSPAERKTALQTTQLQLAAANATIGELQKQLSARGATDELARVLQDQVTAERTKADDMSRLYNEAVHRAEDLKGELARAKASMVELRRQRRSAGSRSSGTAEPRAAFSDPEEQFRYELYVCWAQAVPAEDKAAEPLGPFTVGPRFLDSHLGLPPRQQAKVLRAVVDVAAGREGPLRNREPHPLRQNDGALAAVTTRGEDVCWRLYVEQKAPAALRLHYWKLKNGGIELSRVVGHDDVKP